MANEKTEHEKAAESIAAAARPVARAQMPAKDSPTPAYTVDATTNALKTGNMTRDAVAETWRSKYIEQGMDTEEAQRMAVKRAFEMVRDEEPKK